MKDINYLKCVHCGNIAGKIMDSGVPLICCGEPMLALTANTVDASKEKHVPVIERNGNKVTVKIGGVLHPMLPEHYIQWITLIHGNRRESVFLKPGDLPQAEFITDEKELIAIEHCNLHGLWKAEIK